MDTRLKSRSMGLPANFVFIHPTTSSPLGPFTSFHELVTQIRVHERVNNLGPMPETLIEEQICLKIPTLCREATFREIQAASSEITPESPARFQVEVVQGAPVTAHRLTFRDVVKATKKLSRWLAYKRPKVSTQTAQTRAQVCLACPNHQKIIQDGSPGCCNNPLQAAVTAVVGTGAFEAYSTLGACAACGCSLRAKVQLPLEYLVTLGEALPPNCWIVEESKEKLSSHAESLVPS